VAVLAGDWKMLSNADGTAGELYNIAEDPKEARNRAKETRNRQPPEGLMLRWPATLP
jgi:hypothetical protein